MTTNKKKCANFGLISKFASFRIEDIRKYPQLKWHRDIVNPLVHFQGRCFEWHIFFSFSGKRCERKQFVRVQSIEMLSSSGHMHFKHFNWCQKFIGQSCVLKLTFYDGIKEMADMNYLFNCFKLMCAQFASDHLNHLACENKTKTVWCVRSSRPIDSKHKNNI